MVQIQFGIGVDAAEMFDGVNLTPGRGNGSQQEVKKFNENKVNEKSSLIEKIKKKIKDWRVLTELQNIIRTS